VEETDLAILKADIAAQRQLIDRVFRVLEQRSTGLAPNNPEKLESVAYQLHNGYSAIEDLLKLIATCFENNMSETARWHSLLLQRMTQPIEGVRPAAISMESYGLLNALRAFRHFFRHAYGIPIDFAQLQSNLDKARQLKPLLDEDMDGFIQSIDDLFP
jgi:hypothetical protein